MATIRKRGEKWQVRIQRRGFPAVSKSFTNKVDAARWGNETEIALEQGDYASRVEADRTTLGDVLERYQREITPKKKGAAVEVYRINVLMRSKMAKLKLTAIRSVDISRYRDHRQTEVSASTVKNEVNTLSVVFEACRVEWGLNIENPVRGVKRPVLPQGRDRRLYAGEEGRLVSACEASRAWYLAAAVMLGIETGMRLGELVGLRWEAVDLDRQVAYLPTTKNGTARSVPLSMRAVKALSGLPRTIKGAIFPVQVDAVKRAFRHAVDRARRIYEVEQRARGATAAELVNDPMLTNLHFHDLRHEAVSRLFELGLNPIEVASVSGHKTLGMLKRYTHLRAEDLAKRLG